jgi:hypothetical protein
MLRRKGADIANNGIEIARLGYRAKGNGAIEARYWQPHNEIDVEAPDLTPAQLRADNLVDVLRKAHAWGREVTGPVPAWIAEARELLDQIRPEPPTLAEALELLAAVTPLALNDQMYSEETAQSKADAYDLLDRARRAGLL